MSELSKLPNVGKVLERNLNAIGITTPEQLRATGAKEVFMNIRSEVDPGACLHMLYGIQGAVDGVPYTRLPEETTRDLQDFFNSIQD
ncbi:TfoX/Sxy family protein [Bifidobacterium favimelis]|uniref:TfoX/Sxy family protein n=1 Tax=Bifidobacterium favimelis TaxID=3122979 RepID=A0ABU8ZP07_9BIFI